MWRERSGMTLKELLAIIAAVSLLFALSVASLSGAQKSARRKDCWNSQCQLGTYVVMYVSRYGAGRDYPPAPGLGYFETLSRIPTARTAIMANASGLTCCDVLCRGQNLDHLDFREPLGRIRDGLTSALQPIACDRPRNHDPSGQGDINVLFFSGHSENFLFGSPEWDEAMRQTR